MSDAARAMTAAWVLAIGLSTHALLPYFPFPQAEDFALAALAEAWADPELFPRDDQVRGFAPAPWAYVAVYWLAKATLGTAAGFWLITVLLTLAGVAALHAVMRRLGARGTALPLAVAIGLMAARPGLGSGAAGGLASGFFHHPWIGLLLVFWGFAALLERRPAGAGIAIGLAAYAEPVTALHGALATALACAALGRAGLAAFARMALAGGLVALPAAHAWLNATWEAPVAAERLATDGQLLLEPEHFRLDRTGLLVGWGLVALGLTSALMLRRARPAEAAMALGLMAGLGLLHLVATLADRAVPALPPAVFLLDATRSSPLLFALAAALFAAAAERQAARGEGWRGLLPLVPAAAVAAAIMVLNAIPTGWFFLLAGLLVLAAPDRPVPRLALTATLLLVFAMVTPRYQLRPAVDLRELDLFEWATQTTEPDALFIVPPGMREFRLFARRSVYADFALLAAAGPRRGWRARARLERIAEPTPEALAAEGEWAQRLWDRSYLIGATCSSIVTKLRATGADYFVRPVQPAEERAERDPCGGNPMVAYGNSGFIVYTLDPGKAARDQ